MIIVDVVVPALNRTYNFNLDEEVPISVLIEEISELICKKERSELEGCRERFVMGSVDKKECFDPAESLRAYSVKQGDKLILV